MNKLFIVLLVLVVSACTLQFPQNSGKQPVGSSSSGDALSSEQSAFFKSKIKFLDNGTTIRVFVSLENHNHTDLSGVSGRYTLYSDYNMGNSLSSGLLNPAPSNFATVGEWDTFSFDIEKPKDKNTLTGVLKVSLTKGSIKYENDGLIRFQSGKTSDYFGIFDKTGQKIVTNQYLNQSDTIQLRALNNREQSFLVVRYRHEFEPASSPLAVGPRQAPPKVLGVDSAFSVKANTPFILKTDGLYYFAKDTADNYGIGLTITDDRYPRLTMPDKLRKPLIYVSTSAEANDLYTAREHKKALDRYWLGLPVGNNVTLAKRTIKSFYQRVESANRYFTSYKEGWKTDRGMIFIVMGLPAKISKNKDQEIWTYNRQGQYSEVNFTFNRRNNQFSENHYELLRYAEYQPIWYPAVESWRNGEMASR